MAAIYSEINIIIISLSFFFVYLYETFYWKKCFIFNAFEFLNNNNTITSTRPNYRWWLQGRSFTKDVRIDGKVVIVTGCNTGIGLETVRDLAKRGGKIYMACRDMVKCDAARDDLIKTTGNKNVFSRKLDLASQDSIREFVTK